MKKKCMNTPDDYYAFRIEQKSYQSTDGIIKYIDKGKGEVILLLHGVPSSGWLYRKMTDSLVEKGYRVIVPDMLGFGNSDSPKGYETYSSENHARRLLALMDHLKINQWNHVMHDAGGLWTWELFKKQPERIKSLTILNTIVFKEGFNPPVKMKKGFKAKTAMWAYRSWLLRPILMKGLFSSTLKKETKLTKCEKFGYKKPLKESKTRAMYWFFTQTKEGFPNYEDVYSKINIPVCVIWGSKDEMLKIEPQKEKIKQTFNVKEEHFHVIDSKHFIQEEKPDFIINQIINFIN